MTKDIDNTTLRLAIHDPLQLPEKDFLNTFVARHTILKRLTRHVRENMGAPLLQHRLIFGQRGMGKTSLLRRLAISVKDDPTLNKHWIPLNFREEQYNIGTLDHFWLNCADALADWCEKQGDAESAEQLDVAVGTGKKPYEIIQKTTRKFNRRLLLLVDNLNLILDSLSAQDQWTLREKLQAEDAPLMIACTPSHVPQLADREGPFYDFFAIDDLKPMTPVEMGECLTRLARTRGEPGARVLEDMRRYPARIRVMHTLCGGNPRTLVLIYQVLETIVSTKPMEKDRMGQLLEGVLENATPLYKARTEELPQQQRRIIDAIALQWDPAHSSTISEKTGLAAGSLSAQLKRLQNDGFLRQVPLGPKRKGYQLAERSYNIWYLMRHGTRRNRLRLGWLSSFLSTYYSDPDAFLMMGVFENADRQEISRVADACAATPPSKTHSWNNLGNLLQDHLKRYEESKKAYLTAEKIDPEDEIPKSNRAWLTLKLGDPRKARELAADITLPFPGKELLLAGCDLAAGNPGSCCDILEPILEENPTVLWTQYRDDLLRLTRLFKKYHFEGVFLERLRQKQLHIRLEPYVAAAEAYFSGHERLLLLNPEARSVAEPLYNWLVSEDNHEGKRLMTL